MSVDPCWPSVYSAESGPISLEINAQHGTSIIFPRPKTKKTSSFHCAPPSLPLSDTFIFPQTAVSRWITAWAPDPPHHSIKTVVTTRGVSGERSTGGAAGAGGQQFWTWKNNSCDIHIVIPTFGLCWVRQQVSSQHGNHGTKGALHLHPRHLESSTKRTGSGLQQWQLFKYLNRKLEPKNGQDLASKKVKDLGLLWLSKYDGFVAFVTLTCF